MTFYNYLAKEYEQKNLAYPPLQAIDYLRSVYVDNFANLGYTTDYPFRQINNETTVRFTDNPQELLYEHLNTSSTLANIELIPKKGIKSRLWRVWHGLYPTKETIERGWKLKPIYSMSQQVKRVKVSIVSIAIIPPKYTDNLMYAFHSDTYILHLGYYAAKDMAIVWKQK